LQIVLFGLQIRFAFAHFVKRGDRSFFEWFGSVHRSAPAARAEHRSETQEPFYRRVCRRLIKDQLLSKGRNAAPKAPNTKIGTASHHAAG
jgi:hypothetical protein